MGNRSRFALLLAVLILVDAVLLQILTTVLEVGTLSGRLLSLAGGLVATSLLVRLLSLPAGRSHPPGFWPLVVVGLLLSYGIFAALAIRTPDVQPLVHLAVSWLGALLFGGFGFWRIRRWRD